MVPYGGHGVALYFFSLALSALEEYALPASTDVGAMLENIDNFPKNTAIICRQLLAAKRRFPSDFPVRTVAYIPNKTLRLRTIKDRASFVFILKGCGEFSCDARTWPVEAPCVIVQPVGVPFELGPHKEWEELYINYAREKRALFEARGIVVPDRPVWQLHDAGLLRRRVRELLDALADVDSYGHVDRIDRLCELLIVESLINEATPPVVGKARAILAIRGYLEQHYREAVDLHRLALDHGISPTDFRRKWHDLLRMPPGRFIAQLRIREACRLLEETHQTVSEIAAAIGYDDPLYFSRRFQHLTGIAASRYRYTHQLCGRASSHGGAAPTPDSRCQRIAGWEKGSVHQHGAGV